MNEEMQQRAIDMLRGLLPRQVNPCLNQAAVLARTAKKIERAAERMGGMPSLGAQAVLRCNGVIRWEGCKRIVETGQCCIVAPLPMPGRMLVN